jgi:hypothetical protein
MNAFDNTNLVSGLCGGCDCTGFVASVTFTYNAGAGTITFTDASTYSSGTNRKIVRLRVVDHNGKTIDGNIAAADGDDAVTVDVSSLDASEGLALKATVVQDDGCISDGHYGRIGMALPAAGTFGSWDRESSKIILSDVDASDDES